MKSDEEARMKMSIVWRHDVLEQWEIYGGKERARDERELD